MRAGVRPGGILPGRDKKCPRFFKSCGAKEGRRVHTEFRMQEFLLRTLRAHRSAIRTRWEALLRIEKVTTPLGNPDALVYLFDRTLDDIFAALRHAPAGKMVSAAVHGSVKNPLMNYFVAGEQALLEALVLAQAESRTLDPVQRDADFAQLKEVVHSIAQREIDTLESLHLRHPPYAGSGI